ncbi:tRNA pseudouridine(38-40) synthase TruA [Pelagibius sp. Alg239-R121]|uniref:tRNA pseudouridine(38-40) synthase TruA n=1 Tax=Pelagibius sp. Alg239-R121 TaxID=2993448 RepID=UPI0024A6B375|nr:tRNA pseudouridine(38-40) synthase TruA [Pelagibius sp. Alg239-R121]
MTRYKLVVEYHGGDFVGWQRQDNGPSVQAEIERAVKLFCGETVTASASGRTDAGVHAFGQVVTLDIAKDTDANTVCKAINAHLKEVRVAVLSAEAVDADFHARFSAVGRSYLYRIVNRRAPLALDLGRAWFVPVPLDADAMNEAAQCLVGHHDFSSFRASQCQANSPMKTLDEIAVARDGEEIHLRVAARSFLHHQVRNIVGTLKLVGEGKWSAEEFKAALEACDRSAAGPTAPAHGLYFVGVAFE